MARIVELRCPSCGALLARRDSNGRMEQRRPGKTAVRVTVGEFECVRCCVMVTFSGIPGEEPEKASTVVGRNR